MKRKSVRKAELKANISNSNTSKILQENEPKSKKNKVISKEDLSSDSMTHLKKKVKKLHKLAVGMGDESLFVPNDPSDDFLRYLASEERAAQRQKRRRSNMVESEDDSEEDMHSTSSSDMEQEEENDEEPTKNVTQKRKAFPDRELTRERRKTETEKLSRTIYIGNVSPKTTRKKLINFFKSCGPIESVRIRGAVPVQGGVGKTAKKLSVLHKEFACGEDQKLYAYMVFCEISGVDAAIKLNLTELDQRLIRVDRANKSSYQPKNCVFVGNLAFTTTEEQVRECFKSCGEIVNIRLIRDRATGAVKGFGYVEFSDPSALQFALKMSEIGTINKRAVRVLPYTDMRHNPAAKLGEKTSQKTPGSKSKGKKGISENDSDNAQKKHHIKIPTNLKGAEITRFIRRKQKKLDKKKKKISK